MKSELCPYVHMFPTNYVRMQFKALGVYKESQEAFRWGGIGLCVI